MAISHNNVVSGESQLIGHLAIDIINTQSQGLIFNSHKFVRIFLK